MAMSWEGYSWLLFKACGISMSHHQLLNVLQPYQGRFPSTEAEFNAMQLTLRRMGHILEHAPGNLATQLRSAPPRAFMVGTAGGASTNPRPDTRPRHGGLPEQRHRRRRSQHPLSKTMRITSPRKAARARPTPRRSQAQERRWITVATRSSGTAAPTKWAKRYFGPTNKPRAAGGNTRKSRSGECEGFCAEAVRAQ
jgi:hypothetical protein